MEDHAMTTHVTQERMITFLLATPMFESLDPAEMKEMTRIIDVREFAAGDELFHEGDVGDAWYALYRGKVDVTTSAGTCENEINQLDPGDCFGEIAILDGQPRSATVVALEDSVVLRVTRAAFEQLLAEDDPVAHKLLRHMAISLAQRTRSITERLSELAAESESADCHRGVSKIVNETVLRA
jgi:CRP-like cAMP-binding protein